MKEKKKRNVKGGREVDLYRANLGDGPSVKLARVHFDGKSRLDV